MNLEQQLVHARALRESGKSRAAEKVYRRVLKFRPKHAIANRDYGMLARDLNQPDIAQRCLKRALEAEPEDPMLLEAMGDVLAAQGNLRESCAVFRRAVAVQSPSSNLLCKLGDLQRRTGDVAGAEQSFRQSLELEPGDHFSQIGLGDVLRAQGRFPEALRRYGTASALQPDDELAARRLKGIISSAPQPWHIPMMHDRARNDAFDAVIRDVVKPGDVVLDIGSGSGLLSMMAARAGASKVYGCDDQSNICEAARMIVSQNGMTDRVTILNKRSTDLKVGVDLPRVDVIICEIFDVGFFGEDALRTIQHAHEHLLKPGGRVIPGAVRIWAVPVCSPRLRKRFEIKTAAGFDVSTFSALADPRVMQVYLPSLDYGPLSEPIPALELDLGPGLHLAGQQPSQFTALESGTLDGFAFWYDLIFDGKEILSTGPKDIDTHWMQGFLPQWGPARQINAGETVSLTTNFSRYLLWFDVV